MHSAHRQEDFVIGSKEIAEETGAKIASLDHALFGHSDRDDSPQRIENLEREITLEGRLDDEQRARLLEIADRCPSTRTPSGS